MSGIAGAEQPHYPASSSSIAKAAKKDRMVVATDCFAASDEQDRGEGPGRASAAAVPLINYPLEGFGGFHR